MTSPTLQGAALLKGELFLVYWVLIGMDFLILDTKKLIVVFLDVKTFTAKLSIFCQN